jgi:L-alanine-DL-glutamate epimerase-like enolase superfamily enzyme
MNMAESGRNLRDGRMIVRSRPGLGLSLSEQAAAWTAGREMIR